MNFFDGKRSARRGSTGISGKESRRCRSPSFLSSPRWPCSPPPCSGLRTRDQAEAIACRRPRNPGARRLRGLARLDGGLVVAGPADGPLIGCGGVGLRLRLDAVSATMLLLVSFIGWVVVRYSADLSRRRGAPGRLHGLAVPDARRCAHAGHGGEPRPARSSPGSRPASSCIACCCSIRDGSRRGARRARNSSPRASATLALVGAAAAVAAATGRPTLRAISPPRAAGEAAGTHRRRRPARGRGAC